MRTATAIDHTLQVLSNAQQSNTQLLQSLTHSAVTQNAWPHQLDTCMHRKLQLQALEYATVCDP